MKYIWRNNPPSTGEVLKAVKEAELMGYIVKTHDIPREQTDFLLAEGKLEGYPHPQGIRWHCIRTTGLGGKIRRKIGELRNNLPIQIGKDGW